MDCYSDHSAILDYLAQVEQEEELRESLKSKSGIAALRVERGTGPYKSWEKQPLCDEHGDAASSSANDFEEVEKEHSKGGIVSKQMLQYLIWFNCGLFILVVVGGTMLGFFGGEQHSGPMVTEPPGSLLKDNALAGLRKHAFSHAAPAPAPSFKVGPAQAPSLVPAPTIAPGLAAVSAHKKTHEGHAMGGGKVAGGSVQRQPEPSARSAASAMLAAAQYWKAQQAESMQDAMHTWEDGDLDWTETEKAPAPGLGGFWAAPVPASAPAPAQARKSLAGSRVPPWAHSTQRPAAASQAEKGLPAYPGNSQPTPVNKPWGPQPEQAAGYPSAMQWQPSQPGQNPSKAATQSAQHAQQPMTEGYGNIPSQAALAAQVYEGYLGSSYTRATKPAQTPKPKPAPYTKWAPYHAAPKLRGVDRPAQAGAAQYLTPAEAAAISAAQRQPDISDPYDTDFIDIQNRPKVQNSPWP